MKLYRIKITKGAEGNLQYMRETLDGWPMCTIQETQNGGIWSETQIKQALRRLREFYRYSGVSFTKEAVK